MPAFLLLSAAWLPWEHKGRLPGGGDVGAEPWGAAGLSREDLAGWRRLFLGAHSTCSGVEGQSGGFRMDPEARKAAGRWGWKGEAQTVQGWVGVG